MNVVNFQFYFTSIGIGNITFGCFMLDACFNDYHKSRILGILT
jgi:hypothetical protein